MLFLPRFLSGPPSAAYKWVDLPTSIKKIRTVLPVRVHPQVFLIGGELALKPTITDMQESNARK